MVSNINIFMRLHCTLPRLPVQAIPLPLRKADLLWLHIFVRHLYFSGGWLGVDLQRGTKRHVFKREIGLYTPHFLSPLGSIVNIIGENYSNCGSLPLVLFHCMGL